MSVARVYPMVDRHLAIKWIVSVPMVSGVVEVDRECHESFMFWRSTSRRCFGAPP